MDDSGRLWNLTPYELNRAPHVIPEHDESVVHTTGRLLESELHCAICLDILRNTRTTKECLHRFCYECIQKALTQESEESEERDRKCPCCRKKLVSMRSLRPDPLFDALIKTILPDIHKSGGGLVDLPVDGSSVAGTSRNHTAATDLDLGEPRLHLEIFPYTEQVQHLAKIMKNWSPRRRLVKVSSAASGLHVSKYILSRLIVENGSTGAVNDSTMDVDGIELYIRPKKGEYRLLTNLRLSLKEIHQRHWNIARPMQIYFGFKKKFRLNIATDSPRSMKGSAK